MPHLTQDPTGVSSITVLHSKVQAIRFLDTLDALETVGSKDQFIDWTRSRLRGILPHDAFICVTGRIISGGVVPLTVLKADFPDGYLNAMCTPDGQYNTPIVRRWLASGEPQLFEPATAAPDTDPNWLRLFADTGMRNVAAYGLIDIAGAHASYFSFCRIPGRLGEAHSKVLRLVVPQMHATLLAIAQRHDGALGQQKLSRRECEILAWIGEGKTNQEIAQILGLSFKTVKNRTHGIFAKLQVSTRAQAVAKTIALGLITTSRADQATETRRRICKPYTAEFVSI